MKLNNGDVKRIVELHRAGMKCPAIAVIFGVSKATVSHLISRYRKKGFDAIQRKRKRPRYPRELIDKALEEVRRGGLISEVADRNGVSACLLSYWVRKETSIRYNPSRGEERKDDCRAKKGALGSEETRGPIGAGASKEPGADRSLKKTGCLSSKPTKEERQKIAQTVQGLRQKSTRVTVKALLAKVDMPKATYYDSLKRIAKNKSRDAKLIAAIRDVVEKSRYTYGSPRVSMELDKKGLHIGHNKVARLMRENHLNAKKKRAKYRSYRGQYGQVCGNLLLKERKIPGSKKKVVSRRFRAKAPNRIWVTDVTEFKTEEGKIYLAPIMDLFNQEIVSFDCSPTPNMIQQFAMLDKAFKRLGEKDAKGLIFHSDQGWQYQHKEWQRRLSMMGIRQSMSRKGNCHDNSVMENFFGRMKNEFYYGRESEFKTKEQLVKAIEDYIMFYNGERIQRKLDALSPLDYRRRYEMGLK